MGLCGRRIKPPGVAGGANQIEPAAASAIRTRRVVTDVTRLSYSHSSNLRGETVVIASGSFGFRVSPEITRS